MSNLEGETRICCLFHNFQEIRTDPDHFSKYKYILGILHLYISSLLSRSRDVILGILQIGCKLYEYD